MTNSYTTKPVNSLGSSGPFTRHVPAIAFLALHLDCAKLSLKYVGFFVLSINSLERSFRGHAHENCRMS